MGDPRSVAGSVPGRDQGRRPALKGTFLPYNDLKGTFVSQHATEVPLSSRRKPGPFGSHEVSECATRGAGMQDTTGWNVGHAGLVRTVGVSNIPTTRVLHSRTCRGAGSNAAGLLRGRGWRGGRGRLGFLRRAVGVH